MSGQRVAIVVQARMSSSRLPGKVLMPLAGAPAIVRMLERVERVRGVSRVTVAISDEGHDDPLEAVLRERGLAVARGPLDDVLARVTAAAGDCDAVVRLTGDCPLVDPALVEHHIEVFERERPWAQYVTNAVVRTQPDGLDIEVVDAELLRRADREARTAYDREHVTPWIRRRARTVPISQEVDLSGLRWTLDVAADYEFLAWVYDALHGDAPEFGSADVYHLLVDRPERLRVDGPARLKPRERDSLVAQIEAHLRLLEESS